ncbi:MAG: hypothetical protein II990_03240 [Muribaculaceae bacterium]|nr:hypothetical protein [Muribaculaceae bacterium]MBR3830384.1 hypothetical protein [Muribaculaceae bacterium]
MKKILLILIGIALGFSVDAEQVVGTYYCSYFEKDFEIQASQKNNKLETVYIEIDAKSSKEAFVSIDGKDLELFKTSLGLVRDKYTEWVKIAKENSVTKMYKDFGIKFPKVDIAWLGSKYWFSFNKTIDISFVILDSGNMVAMWCPKVVSSANRYIDETIYFVFEKEEDFDSLINQLDYNSILDKLLNTKKNEDLFK